MDHETAQGVIEAMRAEATGLVTSRSRVVDALLDLRLIVGERAEVVERVDEFLTAVPGVTTAPTEWWLATLEELADLVLDPRGCTPALGSR